MVRRAAGLLNAGAWCFPGGRLEEGETSEDAVRRELEEELGLLVVPLDCVGSVHVQGSEWLLDVWRVDEVGGTLRLLESEVDAAQWLTPGEIAALGAAGLPSNLLVLALLGHR